MRRKSQSIATHLGRRPYKNVPKVIDSCHSSRSNAQRRSWQGFYGVCGDAQQEVCEL
jgi:hypothetical protein